MDTRPSLVGRRYRLATDYEVGREKIREYARAVGDDHPAHHDVAAARALGHPDLIAPATFGSIVARSLEEHLLEDERFGLHDTALVQTDQSVTFHRPIRAGDVLTCDAVIESVATHANTTTVVVCTSFVTSSGEVVQTARTTAVGVRR